MTPRDRLQFRATPESQARVLLLIDAFTHLRGGGLRQLEGRVKLAKLDFLLRYPHHLARVLALRGVDQTVVSAVEDIEDSAPIDSRMMRYRYGPWDPAYYAILGSLIGRGLVEALPLAVGSGFGYRTTERGAEVAAGLRNDESYSELGNRAHILRRYLDKSGSTLKDLLYRLPEVADATWREELN